MSKPKSPDLFDNLAEVYENPELYDYDIVLQFQKGIMEKKELFNQFNILVRTGRFFPDDLLREFLPKEGTTLQLRQNQDKHNLWTLRVSKFHSLKKIMTQFAKFCEEQKLRFIKE